MAENPEQESPQDKKPAFGTGKTVLVIDDDQGTRELLISLLSKAGFTVLAAANGQEGWLLMKPQSMPSLIIADVMMPQMDGFQFLKELKKNKETEKIPMLIVTARKNMEDSFLAVGADSFLLKPIQPEPFLAEVRKLAFRAKTASPAPAAPPKPPAK